MVVVKTNENAAEADKERVARTQSIIDEHGLDAKIIWHDVDASTTETASLSWGVDASDIAKNILFIAKDGSPHMVIMRGDKRVDTKKLKKIIGQKVRIAKPDEVLKHTDTRVGGVTPLGCQQVPKYIDKSLLEKEYVHSSAGSSYTTLLIKTKDLINYTKGKLVDVAE